MQISYVRTHEPTVIIDGRNVTVTSAAGRLFKGPDGRLQAEPTRTVSTQLTSTEARRLERMAQTVVSMAGPRVEAGMTCDWSPGTIRVSADIGHGFPMNAVIEVFSMTDRLLGPAGDLEKALHDLADRALGGVAIS